MAEAMSCNTASAIAIGRYQRRTQLHGQPHGFQPQAPRSPWKAAGTTWLATTVYRSIICAGDSAAAVGAAAISFVMVGLSADKPAFLFRAIPELLALRAMSSPPAPINAVPLTGTGRRCVVRRSGPYEWDRRQ
jgi:hypothetical protein